MVTGRGDMWILNSFGINRELLAPNNEEWYVWPHTSNDHAMCFTRERVATIREVVLKTTARVDLSDKDVVKLNIPVCITTDNQETSLKLPLFLTSKRDMISNLFGRNTYLYDVDMRMNDSLDHLSWDRLACVSVCTLRFDDVQHIFFAIKGDAIVYEAWTLCEEFITSSRTSPHQLEIRLNRSIFLFDKKMSMMSFLCQQNYRRLLLKLFKCILPQDVIHVIANCVCEETVDATIRQFNKGLSKGVFNYSIGRILKIGQYKQFKDVPSLLDYHTMSFTDRCRHYDMLKKIFRNRHRVFDREICHKSTRSGNAY